MAEDSLPTPSNADDVAPVTIRRPDDTTPADNSPEDAEEAELKKQRAIYAQQQADLVQKAHDLEEKFKSQGEPLVNDIYHNLATINATPPAQLDSVTDEYRKEMAQATQEHGPNAFGALFTILGMGLVLAGSRRGWGARAGIWEGMGNAMKYYAQGKEEQSRDQQSKALRMMSLVHQENQERLAQKREILSDKRLTIQQQMDLLKTHHELYQETRQTYKDEEAAIAGETKILDQQEHANQAVRRLKYKYHQETSHMLKSKDAKAWAEYVRVESGGQLDPMRSDAELDAAEKMYPLHDYITQRTGVGKKDEKGKQKEMPKMPGAPATNTPQDTMSQRAKDWWSGQ